MRDLGGTEQSMPDDLRRQKPLEHEYLSGEVVRLGKLHGVETPIHAVFDAALRPIADRLACVGQGRKQRIRQSYPKQNSCRPAISLSFATPTNFW